MGTVSPQHVLSKSQEYRNYTANLLSRLVKIPSLSGKEERIVRFLAEEFKASGADEVQIDGFGNVLARLGSKGPLIAFDAHVDTVDVGQRDLWNFDPYCGEVTGTKVLGRGAADQKGGMASMMAALKILAELKQDLPFSLLFVGSVQEEDCDGLCWQYIIESDKIVPQFVVLTEPSDGKITRGQRGRMEIEIRVTGISCHGSAPDRGENAIYKIASIISALERLNENLPIDPFLGKGTLAPSRLRSSSPSLCAVADAADVYIDRRLTLGETPDSALAQLSALQAVQQANGSVHVPTYDTPGWRGASYPTKKIYPAWTLEESHDLVRFSNLAYKRLFGMEPIIDKWTFSTNGVATMGMFDVPTIGFGPGEEKMAHAPDESISIDDLVRCAAFYAYFPWTVMGR